MKDVKPGSAAPPIDLETLRSLFGDDDEAVREILETYVDDLQNNCDGLREALDARDRRRIGRIAHSVKGASANVGAAPLAGLCASVERRSLDAPWEELDGLVRQLLGSASVALECVRAEVQRLS